MSRIFISYRRDDAGYVAGILADRIHGTFGAGSVFMDVDTIPLGVDFRKHINHAVAQCEVLLAIIGDNWLAKSPDSSKRRIDEPSDFVRIELEAALARNIPVIPVLVGSATMPSPHELPTALEPLAFRNASELRSGRDMNHHVDVLVRGLRVHLAVDERSSKTDSTGPLKGVFSKEWILSYDRQQVGRQLEQQSKKPWYALSREWTASYDGNQIRVTYWWTSGETGYGLYINGTCVDITCPLRCTVQDQGGSDHIVEVVFGGWIGTKAKISVGGVQIGGDSF